MTKISSKKKFQILPVSARGSVPDVKNSLKKGSVTSRKSQEWSPPKDHSKSVKSKKDVVRNSLAK